MKWLFEGVDAGDFPFTKDEWDDALRQCIQMGLLIQTGVNRDNEPLYVLSERGMEYADSAVIFNVATLNKIDGK